MDVRPTALATLVLGAALVGGLGAVAPAAAQDCSFPYTATDATGAEVTVESTPERVVVLGASAAQTMWEIGAKDRVVGMPVNQHTSYLSGYDDRVNVMNPDGFTVNVERVVNLTPDLVLAANIMPTETVEQLRRAGLTVYQFRLAADIEDVEEKTVLTGRLTGHCEAARDRVERMEARLQTVREAVSGEERPTVIYPLGGGFVAGNGTFLHEIIRTAGGRNVAAAAGIHGYGTMSIEVIVTENPEWLILNEGLPTSALQMHAYNHTTAVRKGQIVRVDPNYANQPAPRVVLAVETIARTLHPEAFAAANATATPEPGAGEETVSPTVAGTPLTDTATPAGTAEAPGQPGFGIVAALVALVVALLVRRTVG